MEERFRGLDPARTITLWRSCFPGSFYPDPPPALCSRYAVKIIREFLVVTRMIQRANFGTEMPYSGNLFIRFPPYPVTEISSKSFPPSDSSTLSISPSRALVSLPPLLPAQPLSHLPSRILPLARSTILPFLSSRSDPLSTLSFSYTRCLIRTEFYESARRTFDRKETFWTELLSLSPSAGSSLRG